MIQLKLALIIAVFLFSSVYSQSLVAAEGPEHHKIIVIGAGISGLGAAEKLKELGYDDVVILEARDRIGGRLWSDRSYGDSYALDIGASWIHGNLSNPITILAEKYGAEMTPFDNFDSAIIYDGNEEISDERSEAMETLYKDDFKKFYLEQRKQIIAGNPDKSVQKVVDDFIKEKGLQNDDLKDFLFMLVWELEGDYAGDASEISLLYFDYMGYKMKGREVVFLQGYDKIAKGLAEGLDIRNNTIVKEIDYNDNIIDIKTSNQDFTANYVISTMPLGVMKNKTAVTFLPNLPSEKRDAIDKLQMGVLNKVYFVFPEVFWDDEYDWIAQIPDEKGHWVYFANLHNLTGEPVLLAFNTGSYAREIDSESSDEIIIQQGMDVLQEIYDDSVLPRPLYANVTRWGSDDFAGGSYSFHGIGSTNADFYELSKPLEKKLFFAGEATEVRYPATVHGAYMSGIREALRVQAIDKQYLALQQIENGLLPEYVLCKEGLEVALFAPDAKESICVKSSTKEKLIERGWNLCSETVEQILSAKDPKSLSCKTSLLTYEGYGEDKKNGDNYKTNE